MQRVSIIVPNYNHAPYLRERIDSVLQQSYGHVEVILLDDCSSDHSKEILESYRSAGKVSHIVYNATNSGSTFAQWKKGLELASGDWIWIAESDDVADLHFLEKMLETAEAEGSNFLYCNSRIIDEQGQAANWFGFTDIPSKAHFPAFQESFTLEGKPFMDTWMVSHNFIPNASAVLFKKSLVQRHYFDSLSSFKLLGDWYFWNLILLSNPRIAYVSEPLNHFRTHTNNVRSKRLNNQVTEYPEIIAQFTGKAERETALDTYLYRYISKKKELNLSFAERLKVHRTVLKYGKYFTFVKALLKNRWSNA